MKPSIGILGTGRMGSALARAFLRAEHPTTVWNRTRPRAEPLAALGATIADTVAQAVEAADIVVVNVSDYDASASLLRGDAAGAVRGRLLVELTSGTPGSAREAASWAQAQGAAYLDGAIMATPDFIGTDGGTVLLSGPHAQFEANRAAFRALGGNVRHVGEDPGAASALDSAVLSLMWGALFGTLHSIAVCRAENIGLDALSQLWSETAPVVDGLVADLIGRTAAGRLASDAETLSSIAVHYGAFRHLVHLMDERGLDRVVVDAYDVLFRRAAAAGSLEDDFAAMTRFMERPA